MAIYREGLRPNRKKMVFRDKRGNPNSSGKARGERLETVYSHGSQKRREE
ncbi:MAG: hypothetical protein PHU23_06060 [Dehalococcoidales bacterium]|nr:hypothetical protein [Dehalococcoidales bacterium]